MAIPDVRTLTSAAFSGSDIAIGFPVRPVAGDLLLAFQVADNGPLSALTVSGGSGGWQTIASRTGITDGWAGTRISRRTYTASDPDFYTFGQGSTADGVAAIVAIRGGSASDITIAQDGAQQTVISIPAPAATPATAGTLALRWAAGVSFVPGGHEVVWGFPAGHDPLVSEQSDTFCAAALAQKSLVSTAALPAATFSTGNSIDFWHGFTVIVGAGAGSGSGGPPPTPPTFPAFSPGRGSALYQYFFRRLRDGELLGSLDLAGVNFDRRILQPGTFNATIPVPNRRIADQVAEIIPQDPDVLSSGPGVIVCDIWRAGQPWGEYWITGARIGRSRRSTPTIQIRGSTLDAYPLQVEIQQDLPFTQEDQVEIARQLLIHMQQQPYADISLALQAGTSGVPRDHTFAASDGATYGRRLQELAEIDNGFEWTINLAVVAGALQRQWTWGYPRLGGSTVEHVFVDSPNGGDILEWSEEIDALRGATRWRARGDTPASEADASTTSTPLISASHEATAHLAYWPRIDKTITRSGVSVQQTLEDYAAYWAATVAGALRVESYTVAVGAEPSLTPNDLGDLARIYLHNEWHPRQSRVRRVIGIGVTPTSRQNGKEEMSLVLESAEVT